MAMYFVPQHPWTMSSLPSAPFVSLVQVPLQVPLQMQTQMQAPVRLQVASASSTAPSTSSLKEVNDVPLTRNVLTRALRDLSERLYRSFRRQVRLVVHGGAVMVLHPSMKHRESTQDVDYIHRSFVSEYRALGYADAEQRLRTCIAETALAFGLGADWMNDHADVALPWAIECVSQSTTHDSSNPPPSLTHLRCKSR
jgi:hypothetical protein